MQHRRAIEKQPQTSGFILVGGNSSRMGRDKASLEINGEPLLLRTVRLLSPLVNPVIAVGSPERYSELALDMVQDDFVGMGPLGGIATALRLSKTEWNLIVGCDLPFLSNGWVKWLLDHAANSSADAVVPETLNGLQPLCAMYRSRILPAVLQAISRGVRRVTQGIAGLTLERVKPVQWKEFGSEEIFTNMNTPQEYEDARLRLENKPVG